MFTLKSPAFQSGGLIPSEYAEKNIVSPPLAWENSPKGTESFAIAMTDPDLPSEFGFPRVFAHWLIYNIPSYIDRLEEGVSPGGVLPNGAKELNNDYVTFGIPGYGKGYGGPWPPDASHRYVFTLYAIKSSKIDIPESADITSFGQFIIPLTILTTTLIGYYGPAVDKLPS